MGKVHPSDSKPALITPLWPLCRTRLFRTNNGVESLLRTHSESTRSLADRLNRRVLEAAMVGAGMSTVDGETANRYRLLTDADVSSGNRTETRRRLERDGVDVAHLETDLVSYQAVRSYLKEYRSAEYESADRSNRVSNVVDAVQRLTSRTQSVAQKRRRQPVETNRVSIREFHLFVDISVLCEECNTQYGYVELPEDGRCECQSEWL